MLTLHFCKLDAIFDHEITEYLNVLPLFMRNELLKYKTIHGFKTRLLARLMLLQCLREEKNGSFINEWEKDGNFKPFIKRWCHFNISHSGDFILFLRGGKRVGIDIEQVNSFEYDQLLVNFHPEEVKFIEASNNRILAFYQVWVKKEAFLKAVGIGITTNLEKYDCTDEWIYYNGCVWYFLALDFGNGYVAYSCSEENPETFWIKLFEPRRDMLLFS